MTSPHLSLTGSELSLDAVVAVARARRPVALTADAVARMAASREVVELYLAENRPAYGLTTGLGPRVGDRVPRDELAAFRSEERRGGKEGVSTCRDRWSPELLQKKSTLLYQAQKF